MALRMQNTEQNVEYNMQNKDQICKKIKKNKIQKNNMQNAEQNINLYGINIQGGEMKIDELSFERVSKMLKGTQSQMSMPLGWVD